MSRSLRHRVPVRAALVGLLLTSVVSCESKESDRPLRIAVAASFAPTLGELASTFEARHGARVELSVGSTGKLSAQIENGAPFDFFFAADAERPRRLERMGLTIPGTRFTYALGRLALYAPGRDVNDAAKARAALAAEQIAIAEPELAPYGLAARQLLERWSLWQTLSPRLVRGTNVAQTLHFVESGGADVGLVAWPLVRDRDPRETWLAPSSLHEPIRQEAVQIRRERSHPLATAFLDFMRAPRTRDTLEAYGYAAP